MPYKKIKAQRVIGAEIGHIEKIEVTYTDGTQKDGAYSQKVITVPDNAVNPRIRIHFITTEWVDYEPNKEKK